MSNKYPRPEDLAFSCRASFSTDLEGGVFAKSTEQALGLTKREYFAAAAMTGIFLSATSYRMIEREQVMKEIADDAITAADALIKQLAGETK